MIAYKGQHTIHKTGGQLYWRNRSGAMEGINNGFALFSSENLEAEDQETRFSVRFGLKGVQGYKINGELLKVTEDQFMVMNKGTQYDLRAEDKCDTTMLAFCYNEQFISDFVTSVSRSEEQLLDSFDRYQSDVKTLEFPLHTLLVDDHVKPLIKDIVHAKLQLEREEIDDYCIFNKVLEMIIRNNNSSIEAFKGQDIVKHSTKVELFKRLSIARDYIHAHFTEDLNLSELSRVACLSPYHFHRAFKNTFHITPKKLVTHLRIERAKWLLENRSFSVQMVCQEVGFRDVSSFTRLFASHVNATPSVYRSMATTALRSTA